MTHEQEIAEKLRRLAFELENPPLMSVACHKEIVAVAIRFAEYAGLTPCKEETFIVQQIMTALGGKANPNTLRDEIRRQRGAV